MYLQIWYILIGKLAGDGEQKRRGAADIRTKDAYNS